MSSHRILKDLFLDNSGIVIPDPGASGTITVDRWLTYCGITTAGAESRTLAAPAKEGLLCAIVVDAYVGDLTLTVTNGYNVANDTSITMNSAGDWALFMSVEVGSTMRWRLVGGAGSTAQLDLQALKFTGATGTNEIRLTDNLADALSIEDDNSDIIVFNTNTSAPRITITPYVTISSALTSSSSTTTPVVVMSGTTGNQEIRLTTNLADALSIEDDAGSPRDLMVFNTNTTTPSVTIATLNSTTATVTTLAVTNCQFAVTNTNVADSGGTAITNAKALAYGYNYIVGADNTAAAILPVAVAGLSVLVKNTATDKSLPIFPQVNSAIDGLGANNAYTMAIANSASCVFIARTTTQWDSFSTATA